MGDLLQSQIRDSCLLALPEGLKDLMSDISREVLRTQPENLYQFIADYLSALLVAREHLFIAARVCDDVCKNRCCQELEDELRELSLSEEDVQKSLEIIKEYFSSGEVKESNLLMKLVQKTSIGQKELAFVQEAVRRAFLRHQVNQNAPIESSSSDSDTDATTLAAKHTLKIYKKVTEQPDINYHCVAAKIQAAYRAYNLRRKRAQSETNSGKRADTIEKVRFQVKQEKPVADLVQAKKCPSKCSSESLAGSFVSLPPYKPYRIDQRSMIPEQDEVCEKEKEHATFDYITNVNSRSPIECQEYNDRNEIETKKEKKTISFHNLPKVVEVDYNEVLEETDEENEFEEIDEFVNEEQLSDEEKVIEIAAHNHDLEEEMTNITILNKGEDSKNFSTGEKDDEVYETEIERTTKNWISDESSQVTTDNDDFDDDLTGAHDRNADDIKDTSSEISYMNGRDDEYVDELLDAVADDMDLMSEYQLDNNNGNTRI